MSIANPFQIPSCLKADLQRRRQERFKKFVVATVAASASLLVVLLIVGCMNEQSRSATAPVKSAAVVPVEPQKVAAMAPKPAPAMSLNSAVPSPVAPPASVAANPVSSSAANAAETVYVVKSGDTLSRIAKLYRTTTEAIKSANDLNHDKIVVGAKLKLPAASNPPGIG